MSHSSQNWWSNAGSPEPPDTAFPETSLRVRSSSPTSAARRTFSDSYFSNETGIGLPARLLPASSPHRCAQSDLETFPSAWMNGIVREGSSPALPLFPTLQSVQRDLSLLPYCV